jgi:hypothetical protein
MRSTLTQLVLISVAYALAVKVVRYCEKAREQRKATERQLLTWETEGGTPASTAVS